MPPIPLQKNSFSAEEMTFSETSENASQAEVDEDSQDDNVIEDENNAASENDSNSESDSEASETDDVIDIDESSLKENSWCYTDGELTVSEIQAFVSTNA